MRCSNCGLENEPDIGTCVNCGAKLGASAADTLPPKPVVARPRETRPLGDAAASVADGEVDSETDSAEAEQHPDQSSAGAEPSPQAEGSSAANASIPEAQPIWQPEQFPDQAAYASQYAGQTGYDTQYAAQSGYEPAPGATPIETAQQTPADGLGSDSFIAGSGAESRWSGYALPLVALLLGIVIGALITYLVIPGTEYIYIDTGDEPAPAPTEILPAGVVLVPVPPGRAGPVIPPGPDYQTQVDLRNALLAVKRYYIANGKYTQETADMAKLAPEVAWEPGVTPSRVGVVSISLCGPAEASTAVILQATAVSGRTYGILDQPSGPSSGVYYAMASHTFTCPNAMPPLSPWQRSLAGWGLNQPTAAPSPTATYRDDRNDPVPPFGQTPPGPTSTGSPTPVPTGYPTNPFPGSTPLPG